MSNAAVTVEINAPSTVVFDLIHDYPRRLEWDSFLREAKLLDGALTADRGVSSRCVARWAAGGLGMDTVYVSYTRPRIAAVEMKRGPFFLKSFAASIRQESIDDETTRVTYRYKYVVRPRRLAFLIEPIVGWIFHRETQARLAALKSFLEEGRG